MSEDEISDSQRLLVGRHLLDGAAPAALAEKYSLSVDDIVRCKEYCRERLSVSFAEKEGGDYAILSDDELQERIHACIHLLVEWRDQLLQEEQMNETSKQALLQEHAKSTTTHSYIIYTNKTSVEIQAPTMEEARQIAYSQYSINDNDIQSYEIKLNELGSK